MSKALGVSATALRDLGLRDAPDHEIFARARLVDAIVLTKDSDFVHLVETLSPPPRVLWLTIGNTSNACVEEVLLANWALIARHFAAGEPLVEVQGTVRKSETDVS